MKARKPGRLSVLGLSRGRLLAHLLCHGVFGAKNEANRPEVRLSLA
jgi:hypothetical protein